MAGELEVSSALARVGGCLEEAGFPADYSIPTVGSIWSATVGWILLRLYPMTVQCLDDLVVPILMGLARTVNSGADLGLEEKACLASRRCRARVSGRPVRNLIFPHYPLTGENSMQSSGLVALAAQAVDGTLDRLGSEALAGMARKSVLLLLLSATARRPMHSYPQHPVSDPRKNQ